MPIKSKINTLIWYLLRPKYYSQLKSLITQKLKSDRREASRQEAELWCSQNSIPSEEAIKNLCGTSKESIEGSFSEIFENANQITSKLPVKMGGGSDINLLYHLSESIKATHVIETGVAHGWSTLAILLSISQRQNYKLISTDMPYAKMGNEDFVGCVIPENLKEYWHLIRLPDKKGLPVALKAFDYIDLCHYDSDKSYKGRTWAYPLLWLKLRPGGIFISDDIGDNIAFREFSEKVKIDPIVVRFKNQFIGVLIKPNV